MIGVRVAIACVGLVITTTAALAGEAPMCRTPPAAASACATSPSSPLHLADATIATRKLWVALVAGLSEYKQHYERQHVTVAAARYPDRASAETHALESCRRRATGGEDCKVVDAFNNGCSYIAEGTTPWGPARWITGETPQAAYDKCHADGYNCETSLAGGCSDPADDLPRDNVSPGQRWTWRLALAAGLRNDAGGVFVAVGSKNAVDADDARAGAVRNCENAGGFSCHVLTTIEHGCAFLAFGKSGHGNTGYAVGATREEAREKCSAQGLNCVDEIGDCLYGQ